MSVKGIKYTTYYFNIRSKRYRVSERIDEIIPETIDLTSDSDEEGKPSLSKRRTAAKGLHIQIPKQKQTTPREEKTPYDRNYAPENQVSPCYAPTSPLYNNRNDVSPCYVPASPSYDNHTSDEK